MEIKSNNLYTLMKSTYLYEVELAKSQLSQQGIMSFIFDRNLDNIIGTTISEGYRLMVDLQDHEAAKKILENSGNKSD